MNLHHLIQSLRDSAITLEEFSELGHFGASARREIIEVIRGCRLILEELSARAVPVEQIEETVAWMEMIEELDLARGRLDYELAHLKHLVREGVEAVELELALGRIAKRIDQHVDAEFAVLGLANTRVVPRPRRAW